MITAFVTVLTAHAGWTSAHWPVLLVGGVSIAIGRRFEALVKVSAKYGLVRTAVAIFSCAPSHERSYFVRSLVGLSLYWSVFLTIPYALAVLARMALLST
jgi:hypothetical protein